MQTGDQTGNRDRPGSVADFRKALELRPDLQTARDSLQKLGVAL